MRVVAALSSVGLAFAVSSCSGGMDVRACLLDGRLAFELGNVSTFLFFKGRPAPHIVSVQIPGEAAWKDEAAWKRREMWNVESYAHAKPGPAKRSIVLYGQKLDGFTILQAPRPLRPGVLYRAWVSAGGFVGSTDFVYSPELPPCTASA